jgi:glycosyltransferase involved in cell wall biosynthesis
MAAEPAPLPTEPAAPALRVIMLSEHPYDDSEAGFGGILQATAQFVSALAERPAGDVDFHLVSFSNAVDRPAHRDLDGVTVHYLPRGRNPLTSFWHDNVALLRLLAQLKKGGEPYVIHAQGHVRFIVLSLLLARRNVQTLHGLYGREQATIPAGYRTVEQKLRFALKGRLERWYLRRIRHLIAISDEIAAEVRRAGGHPLVYRIENPIDRAYFEVATRRRPSLEGAPLSVLFVAAITPRKGVHLLLDAVEPLLADGRIGEVVVAGTWDWAPDYVAEQRARCEAEPALAGVRFTGSLSTAELLDAYARADVLVLPSLAETKPMVIAQAQCAGVPVIATAVGGVPEMIDDGESGLLAAPGDAASLRSALGRIAAEPLLRRRLQAGGRAAARRDDAAAIVAATFEVYRRIAGDVVAPTVGTTRVKHS